MKLSAPKNITFYIAAGLALIGFIGFFVAAMAVIAPWLVLAGFVVLAAATCLKTCKPHLVPWFFFTAAMLLSGTHGCHPVGSKLNTSMRRTPPNLEAF